MSKRGRNLVNTVLGALGTLVGGVLALGVIVAFMVVTGLALGRALDLLQGAQPRLLADWTVALDGWAVLFAAYVLVWLPLASVVRAIRAPPKVVNEPEE